MVNKYKFIQVFTTVSKKSDAEKVAHFLIDKKLSACVQIIGPVTSVYRWRDKTEESKEWIIVAKTRKSRYKEIENTIKKSHPYELPEIIAVPIIIGSKEYLKWIDIQL